MRRFLLAALIALSGTAAHAQTITGGSSGISSLTGDCTGTGPGATAVTCPTVSVAQTHSAASAASAPADNYTGTIFTGGSGTTNFPHVLIQPSGATASTGWSTAGTAFGINTTAGFTGKLVDYRVGGGANYSIGVGGAVLVGPGGSFLWTDQINGGTNGFYYDQNSGQVLIAQRNATNIGVTVNQLRIQSGVTVGFVPGGLTVTSPDTTFCRAGVGIIAIGSSTTCASNGTLQAANYQLTTATVVGSLGTCDGSTNTYATKVVTDATAPTYLTTLVGGGAVKVKAFCNGANWVAD